eukprot:681238_1
METQEDHELRQNNEEYRNDVVSICHEGCGYYHQLIEALSARIVSRAFPSIVFCFTFTKYVTNKSNKSCESYDNARKIFSRISVPCALHLTQIKMEKCLIGMCQHCKFMSQSSI